MPRNPVNSSLTRGILRVDVVGVQKQNGYLSLSLHTYNSTHWNTRGIKTRGREMEKADTQFEE